MDELYAIEDSLMMEDIKGFINCVGKITVTENKINFYIFNDISVSIEV